VTYKLCRQGVFQKYIQRYIIKVGLYALCSKSHCNHNEESLESVRLCGWHFAVTG